MNPRPSLNDVGVCNSQAKQSSVAGGEPPALIERRLLHGRVLRRRGVSPGVNPRPSLNVRQFHRGDSFLVLVSPGVNPRPSLNG